MGDPVLAAKGVHKSYAQGDIESQVLRGVDFSVSAGEFVAVVGPSGSGKSTLLNILGLMDEPTSGEVVVLGAPAHGVSEDERSRLRNLRLGFVFQFDSLLPEFTVLENVLMPARIRLKRERGDIAEAEARARKDLEALGLGSLLARFPSQLSGGERQRAAIARALNNVPSVILADEPTGNLDRRSGELVLHTLRERAESAGVAVVLVTHNEEAVRRASRAVHLLDGKLEDAPNPVP